MSAVKERILVVENDPAVSDLIARQALISQGYDVKVVADASAAIQQAMAFSPDLVIANLELPRLSGKDLMVALGSQRAGVPVIVIGGEGKEYDVIQAFRLGASDYIRAPVREAEVVSAVERALQQVRARRERQRLQGQLQQANQELQKRVRELVTIFSVGKAVTSITDQRDLFQSIVEAVVEITEADYGWLLVCGEQNGGNVLRAHHNLPKSLAGNLNQPWDDGISSLVALSGKTLSIHSQALKRFKIASLGQAAMVVPVKVKDETVALLVVMRKTDREFGPSDQAILEAISDYAAISLVNARLFRALDERAATLQKAVEKSHLGEQMRNEIIQNVSHELRTPLSSAKGYVEMFVSGELGRLNRIQRETMDTIDHNLDHIVEVVEAMSVMMQTYMPKDLHETDLSALTNQAIGRFQELGKHNDNYFVLDLPKERMTIFADPAQIGMVFDALFSNAIKFSPRGGQVTVRVGKELPGKVRVSVQDEGIGIDKRHHDLIFQRFYQVDGSTARKYGGTGIGLALVKEIVEAHGGEVGVESRPQAGATFCFTLPLHVS